MDSIRIKGTYRGCEEKKKLKKYVWPPGRAVLSFWNFLQVLKIFCRAQTKFFLKCPEKNLGKKKTENFENFLYLDLENFQKLKTARPGGQTYFFRFLVFISWIGTLNPNGIHLREKIY